MKANIMTRFKFHKENLPLLIGAAATCATVFLHLTTLQTGALVGLGTAACAVLGWTTTK